MSPRPIPRRRADGSTYQPSTCGTGMDSQPSENDRTASSRNPSAAVPSSAINTAAIVGTVLPSKKARACAASSSAAAEGQSRERNLAHVAESPEPTERILTSLGFPSYRKGASLQ